jgi:hypothetical protein
MKFAIVIVLLTMFSLATVTTAEAYNNTGWHVVKGKRR